MPLLAEAEPFRHVGAVRCRGCTGGPQPVRPRAGRSAGAPFLASRGREVRAAGPAGLRILTRRAVRATAAVDGGLAFVREHGSSGEGAGHD